MLHVVHAGHFNANIFSRIVINIVYVSRESHLDNILAQILILSNDSRINHHARFQF
jgi:hypothetical protein